MKPKYIALLACLLLICAILNPFRYAPLAGFWSEACAFAALACMAGLLYKSPLHIPKISLPMLLIATIPLVQYGFGQIIFFQDAFFSGFYVLAFWFAFVVAYNLCTCYSSPHTVMVYTAYTFLIAGVVSCIITLCQWLNLEPQDYLLMLNLKSNRPYANLGQPNHLATFLLMSLMACLYLFEHAKLKPYVALALVVLMLFCIALTQSRTAWLASGFIFIFLLFKLNQHIFKFNRIHLTLLFAVFWLFLFSIPWLGQLASSTISAETVQTASVIQRSSAGFERMQIWQQLWMAVLEQPWTGYGWYQVTAAQYAVTLDLPVHVWLTSSHNIVLDILLWSGVFLGGGIVLYALYFFASLIFKAKSVHALCASLMISVVLIHALLEYPLFYAYFLLPLGVLAGIAWADQTKQNIRLQPIWLRMLAGLYLVVLVTLGIQYTLWLNADRMQHIAKTEQYFYSFDKLAAREQWRQFDPQTQVSAVQLVKAQQMVQTALTAKNLKKYAALLAYNGQRQQAEQQLKILAVMYDEHFTIDEILAEQDTAHD